MKKKNTKQALTAFFLFAGLAGIIYFAVNSSGHVGSVNDAKISKSAYEKKVNQSKRYYQYAKQNPSEDVLEQAAFDRLVTAALIDEYAQKNNIAVSQEDIKNRYEQVVAGYNRNHDITGSDDSAFLAQIREMYGIDKNTYLEEVKSDLLKEKIQEKTGVPFAVWLEEQKNNAAIIRN